VVPALRLPSRSRKEELNAAQSFGTPLKVVQERLGHSTISITLGVYGHVTESMQDDAMQKLDEAFSRPS
jgi:integrase